MRSVSCSARTSSGSSGNRILRVIAGSAGGTRLASVPRGVRPTSDRVRESLFNSLGQFFEGGRVLDLYAGTGALGIEALSRGCGHAVFVERDQTSQGRDPREPAAGPASRTGQRYSVVRSRPWLGSSARAATDSI